MGWCRRRCHILAVAGAGLLAIVALSVVPSPASGADASWTSVSVGAQTPDNHILLGTSCPNAWSCWSVGATLPAGNGGPDTEAFAERWNGSSWTTFPVDSPGANDGSLLYDVSCVSSSDCWAVGVQSGGRGTGPNVLAEHWDGAAWSIVGVPAMSGYLMSVACVSSDNCWAVGSTYDPTTTDPLHSFALHWNGSAWLLVSIPSSGQNYDLLTGIACTNSSNCWAVGAAGPQPINSALIPNVYPETDDSDPWIVHWNGAAWSGAPTPDTSSPNGAILSGVSCVAGSECWAVGSTMDDKSHPLAPLVEEWNGASWTATLAPAIGTNAMLSDVSCASSTECWAVGAYVNANVEMPNGPGLIGFAEQWDGATWSIDPTPNATPSSYLYGLACIPGSLCVATGFVGSTGNTPDLQPLIEVTQAPATGQQGFLATATDGGVFTFGDANFYGSMGGTHLDAPIVGMAATPDGGGYWLVAADGGVFAFGDANFYGSMGGTRLDAPIVAMAATPDGGGYWLVAADGGVFAFGDANFYGSMGGTHLDAPIVGMAATQGGAGYWMVASDGGVFAFGDANFDGSMSGAHLDAPIVKMAATPDDGGYWLLGSDGGVFAVGDAAFFGSVPAQGLVANGAVVGISVSPDGHGYRLVTAKGSVYSYGDAGGLGNLAQMQLNAPIIGVTPAI